MKQKTVFVCSECGYESAKWSGRCPDCGAWNSMNEELRTPVRAGKSDSATQVIPQGEIASLQAIDVQGEHCYDTGIRELNRVLGGGLVIGSVVLLGGDPGIGKSTLMLQLCGTIRSDLTILYITGEESRSQIKLRAQRLGVTAENLFVATHTDLDSIINSIQSMKPNLVMVDSIQTVSSSAISSSPGSVTQVRECTLLLTRLAKNLGIPMFIVGHVNKDGAIAGPKVLEHIVDTVLYFEGERNLSYRILRAVKNRFGSTNEIGMFEMRASGLADVENPSSLLLSERPHGVSGNCVCCLFEGTRPILAEVQALVSKSSFGTPRRTANGFDNNRIALLIAVLEKRAGFFFGNMDTYINVVGGIKLDEPAADLPVALALLSSLTDTVLGDRLAACGEIGLAGELRSVTGVEQRVAEAARLGFTECIVPAQCAGQISGSVKKEITIHGVKSVSQAFALLDRK